MQKSRWMLTMSLAKNDKHHGSSQLLDRQLSLCTGSRCIGTKGILNLYRKPERSVSTRMECY